MKPDDAAIGKAAAEFRSALDAIDERHLRAVYIDHFPRGACGHCSELVALFLLARFGITADYVCCELTSASGDRENRQERHEREGLTPHTYGDPFDRNADPKNVEWSKGV